jgi:hypothetical protein
MHHHLDHDDGFSYIDHEQGSSLFEHQTVDDLWTQPTDGLHGDFIQHDDLFHADDPSGLGVIADSQTLLGDAGELHYLHFDPTHTAPGIIGDPGHDMTYWHHQSYNTTCAIASQESVLDSFELHVPEYTLRMEAMLHGWYTLHGGTPLEHTGDLLAFHGIPIERHFGGTTTELADRLSHGQKIIVGINAEQIWFHGTPDAPLSAYPGIPGQGPDHAVEVIGVDNTDPRHPAVILNDSGIPDGRGIVVPIDIFEQAWATSDHFLVAAHSTTQ